MRIYAQVVFLLLLIHVSYQQKVKNSNPLKRAQETHNAITLTQNDLETISVRMSNINEFKSLLNPILVPRVVGTTGHDNVKEYLINKMISLGWSVEEDKFTDRTPVGDLQFTNIVARLNPQASRYLVLACHYDSKLTNDNAFIGATDSAVPCAMMLDLAHKLQQSLERSKQQSDVSLKFIFFDGEEAFVQWGPKDSIYGARHLAKKFENEILTIKSGQALNNLNRMDLLVLLDLLGAPNPKIYSYFRNTEKWYLHFSNIENRLRNKVMLEGNTKYFQQLRSFSGTEDDHIPFLQRGVPILHIIPEPFPTVWHTNRDNESALDYKVIEDFNKLLRVFVAEYMSLRI